MGKQRILQNRANRNVWEGFGIDDEDLNRAVAVKHVIDVNKRKSFKDEPKFTG